MADTIPLYEMLDGGVVGWANGPTGFSRTDATTATFSHSLTVSATLTAADITVDNLSINGNTITANTGAVNITPAAGSAIVLDGAINVDAGVITGATSIASTVIELGHATDTTIARSAAGTVTIEGDEVTTNTATQTLTNKSLGATTVTGDLSVDTISDYSAGDLTLNPTDDVVTLKNVGIGTTAPQSLLDVQGPIGTGATCAGILTLATKETSIVDGDQLGRINFNAPLETDGGDAILAGAAIWAEADATFSATVNNTELVFGTATTSAAVERMRIDSAGNVGIGTATPAAPLDVSGDVQITAGNLDFTAASAISTDADDLTLSPAKYLQLNPGWAAIKSNSLFWNEIAGGGNVFCGRFEATSGNAVVEIVGNDTKAIQLRADTGGVLTIATNATVGADPSTDARVKISATGDMEFQQASSITTATGDLTLNPTDDVVTLKNVGIGTTAPQSLLDVQGPIGTGATCAGILTLATKELTIADGDQLGRIDFNAPLATIGGDAQLAGAAIWAEADATFSATVNNTELVFGTATTSAAVERMRIDSAGNLAFAQASSITTAAGDLTLSATGADIVLNANSHASYYWRVSASGNHLVPNTSATSDIGTTSLKVRSIYADQNLWAGDITINSITTHSGDLDLSSASGNVDISTGSLQIDGDLAFDDASAISTDVGDLTLSPVGDVIVSSDADSSLIVTGTHAGEMFRVERTDTSDYLSVDFSLGNCNIDCSTTTKLSTAGVDFLTYSTATSDLTLAAVDTLYLTSTDVEVSGNLGIGTVNPAVELDVTGDAAISGTLDVDTITASGDLTLSPTGDVVVSSANLGVGGAASYRLHAIDSGSGIKSVAAFENATSAVASEMRTIFKCGTASAQITQFSDTHATSPSVFRLAAPTAGTFQILTAGSQSLAIDGSNNVDIPNGELGVDTITDSGGGDLTLSPAGKVVVPGAGGLSGQTAGVNGDEFVIDAASGNLGMSLLGSTTSNQYIYFGDTDGSEQGIIGYQHTTDNLLIQSAGDLTVKASTIIDQVSLSGAVPVLKLDQADIDDSFIDFIGTSAADGSRSISSDTTEDSAKFGAIRVEINGVTKWIRIYDDES